MSKSFSGQAVFLIEGSLDLIKQVLVKHSAAVLEEMRGQIVERNDRIAELERQLNEAVKRSKLQHDEAVLFDAVRKESIERREKIEQRDELISKLKSSLSEMCCWANEISDEYLDGDTDTRVSYVADLQRARELQSVKLAP